MPCGGCSVLHGKNPNFLKRLKYDPLLTFINAYMQAVPLNSSLLIYLLNLSGKIRGKATKKARSSGNTDMSTNIYEAVVDPETSDAVAEKLYSLESLKDLDVRVIQALMEFSEEDVCNILDLFAESELTLVQNKSDFLRGVIKGFRSGSRSAPIRNHGEGKTRRG